MQSGTNPTSQPQSAAPATGQPPQDRPRTPGVHHYDGQTTFVVWAPRASAVDLVVETAGHGPAHHAMQPLGPHAPASEHWTVTVETDLPTGTRYGYSLDRGPVRPDPRTRHQPDGIHRMSAIDRPGEFAWQFPFDGVPLDELVLYEVHIGTFTPEGTFDAAITHLPDLADLGITAIEVMPVSQFPGRRGWGYDGVHPFAVQNTYGGPDAFRRFIDAAHGLGIGVHLDVVYNHFGPEGNYLGQFGPYLTGTHHTPWGDAVNFDDCGADGVRRFVTDNVRQWIGEYRLDGLRLDAIQTIFDVSAVPILSEIAVAAHEAAGDRTIQVIGETDQNDRRLVTPIESDGVGLDGIWADDFHHAMHALVTGESQTYYADFQPPYSAPRLALANTFQKGLSRDGRYSVFRGHSFGRPWGQTDRSRLVVSIQNHDQVGNRAWGERLPELCSPAANRLAAALMLLSPNTPLLFAGEEYAEDRRFPFFCDFESAAINDAVRHGRAAEYWPADVEWTADMPDPPSERTFSQAILSWDWRSPTRAGMRRLYRDLLARRRTLAGETAATLRECVLIVTRGETTVRANLTGKPRPIDLIEVAWSSEQPDYAGDRPKTGQVDSLLPWEVVIDG